MRALSPAAGLALAAGLAMAANWPGASPGGHRTVVLTIHHSQFSASHVDVAPGTTVRFVVRNTDPIAHELIVGDESVQRRHELGTESHHAARPGEVSVAAGATAVTEYAFSGPGAVLFGCHLPGHWAYGMHGTVRVA